MNFQRALNFYKHFEVPELLHRSKDMFLLDFNNFKSNVSKNMSSLCPFLTIFIMNLIIQKCFEAIFSILIDVQSNNFADLIWGSNTVGPYFSHVHAYSWYCWFIDIDIKSCLEYKTKIITLFYNWLQLEFNSQTLHSNNLIMSSCLYGHTLAPYWGSHTCTLHDINLGFEKKYLNVNVLYQTCENIQFPKM